MTLKFDIIITYVLLWNMVLLLLTRSSTTPSRNFTTSPKLSSNSTASISSTVTNGDSSGSPGYTLNNSTSSGNRQVVIRFLTCHWFLYAQSTVLYFACAFTVYFRWHWAGIHWCFFSDMITWVWNKHITTRSLPNFMYVYTSYFLSSCSFPVVTSPKTHCM